MEGTRPRFFLGSLTSRRREGEKIADDGAFKLGVCTCVCLEGEGEKSESSGVRECRELREESEGEKEEGHGERGHE